MTRARKLIALTQRVEIDPAHGERRDALDQRWAAFLSACGCDAAPIPNAGAGTTAWLEATKPDGLILTGGNDLAALGGNAPERDETEASAVAWATARRLPVLGVCRGMQFLAHQSSGKLEKIAGHIATRHGIKGVLPERTVNSYHQWAVREVDDHWNVLVRAPDGSIESMAHQRDPILGVMWHPERETPFQAADLDMIRHHFGS